MPRSRPLCERAARPRTSWDARARRSRCAAACPCTRPSCCWRCRLCVQSFAACIARHVRGASSCLRSAHLAFGHGLLQLQLGNGACRGSGPTVASLGAPIQTQAWHTQRGGRLHAYSDQPPEPAPVRAAACGAARYPRTSASGGGRGCTLLSSGASPTSGSSSSSEVRRRCCSGTQRHAARAHRRQREARRRRPWRSPCGSSCAMML